MYKWRNEHYKYKLTLASMMIFIFFSCELHLALVPRWKENMNNVCFHLWQKSQAVPSDPHLLWSRGTSLWYLACRAKKLANRGHCLLYLQLYGHVTMFWLLKYKWKCWVVLPRNLLEGRWCWKLIWDGKWVHPAEKISEIFSSRITWICWK